MKRNEEREGEIAETKKMDSEKMLTACYATYIIYGTNKLWICIRHFHQICFSNLDPSSHNLLLLFNFVFVPLFSSSSLKSHNAHFQVHIF